MVHKRTPILTEILSLLDHKDTGTSKQQICASDLVYLVLGECFNSAILTLKRCKNTLVGKGS